MGLFLLACMLALLGVFLFCVAIALASVTVVFLVASYLPYNKRSIEINYP